MEGALLEDHYRKTLIELGKSGGMLGIIFRKAQNKIQDPRLGQASTSEQGCGCVAVLLAARTVAGRGEILLS
jgi:hypothetical protein